MTEITSGRPEGVWIVYDWWRYDDDDDELYYVEEELNGLFSSDFHQDRIACVKVGEDFTDWTFSDDPKNMFELHHIVENEPE